MRYYTHGTKNGPVKRRFAAVNRERERDRSRKDSSDIFLEKINRLCTPRFRNTGDPIVELT